MMISLVLTAAVVVGSVEPSRPRAFHLPPPAGERGCFSYPRLSAATWPEWSLEGGLYVGGSPLAPAQRAGCAGPPAAAYQMATSSGWTGTACLALGGVQDPQVSALPGAEPSAGIRLHYAGGNSSGCGLRRAFEARLVCDPAGSASGSLFPIAMEGDCSAAYNGSYIFRWSTPLACPDYNASATCPPPPPGPLTWPLRHPRSTKRWGPPTWNMSMSTIMMPCNTSGAFDSELAAQYGIVDLDWSNMRAQWANDAPMDDNARLLEQVRSIKARNPRTHTWIYRNLVKALSWYKDVGEKLADPAYSGWFLARPEQHPHPALCGAHSFKLPQVHPGPRHRCDTRI